MTIVGLLMGLAGNGCYQTQPEPSYLPPTVQDFSNFLSMSVMPEVLSDVNPKFMELQFVITSQDGVTRRVSWKSEEVVELAQESEPSQNISTPRGITDSSRSIHVVENTEWAECMSDSYIIRLAAWLRGHNFLVTQCQRVYGIDGKHYADVVFDGYMVALQIEGDEYVDLLAKKREFLRRQGYAVYTVDKDRLPDTSLTVDKTFLSWVHEILRLDETE